MGKLLLTSGQVQALLSSIIIAAITFFLFLAGYTIQQHSITALRQELKPRIPTAPPPETPAAPLAASLQASRLFGGTPNSKGHVAFQQFLSPQQASPVDWKKLAHVQLVTDHHSVCNAVMLFGELHRLKSPARRILMFPKAWAMEKQAKKGDAIDPFMDSTRRLLRRAARRYRVELRPISPLTEGANEEDGSNYSLASIWSLADVERAMILAAPGLINDATPLDSVLAYAPTAPLTMLQANNSLHISADDLILAAPAQDTYSNLKASEAVKANPGFKSIQSILPDPLIISSNPSEETTLINSIGSLHATTSSFNATAFTQNTAYIRFSDPKLPGPEWEVPYTDIVAARPENKDADWVWTKLYGEFALKRFEICGLYLEPWRKED